MIKISVEESVLQATLELLDRQYPGTNVLSVSEYKEIADSLRIFLVYKKPSEWVSNENHFATGRPHELNQWEEVEVLFNDGIVESGAAYNWNCAWEYDESSPDSIKAYRKI